MAEAVQCFLDSGDRSAIGERERLSVALERVKARGERAWLFCDTIGG